MTVIEEYINDQHWSHQERLTLLYETIKKKLPDAEERISYGMPTFWKGKNLVHFALFKNHIGFFPSPSPILHFSEELTSYHTSKGTIQFQHNEELPIDLIEKIIEFRKQEMNLI